MGNHRIIAFVLVLLTSFLGEQALSQTIKTQQGAVLKRGSNLRISGASIKNKRSQFSVASNGMGIFSILASPGDTLEVSEIGYMSYSRVVTDFNDAIVYLQEITRLEEVVVTGKSLESDLNEIKDAYRSKGSYYGGKPPVLAYIFSPLSALGERFGKTGKRARRFNDFANQELEYQEVARRFNDLSIRNAVPDIKPEELQDFRADYLPTVEQMRSWNEYDLVVYIRKSYKEFKSKEKASAGKQTP